MTTLRLVDGKEQKGEEVTQVSLRPSSLEHFIGQDELKKKLGIAIKAAQMRKEPLEHLLLYGPPGLGKTTLAQIVAAEMGAGLVSSSGPALERGSDLLGILTSLNLGDVFFVDEIHRLPRTVEEFLYSAMEDFKLDFVVDKGPFAKTIKITLKPFTLIGATTRAGLLSAPLRERFGLVFHLDFYNSQELEEVLRRSANILGVEIEGGAASTLAGCSRGTPRIANRLLRRVRDYTQVEGDGVASEEAVHQALGLEGIDLEGLDELDRKFLRTLMVVYRGGPVGLETLAATLNESSDTLQDIVEPYLLKQGFISRTAQGRRATELAYSHLRSRGFDSF